MRPTIPRTDERKPYDLCRELDRLLVRDALPAEAQPLWDGEQYVGRQATVSQLSSEQGSTTQGH